MTRLRCSALLSLFFGFAPLLAYCQDIPGGWKLSRPNQEVRVAQLPSTTARSHDPSDVVVAALEIAFDDPTICCRKNSALEDRGLTADPQSLKDIASKVQGRWLLSDGRPIQIKTNFLPATASVDNSYWIVNNLRENHAMLLVWDSRLYVLYGALFDEDAYSDGSTVNMIHKLLLIDPRYSDFRRQAAFNRDTDDWSKVQGMLLLTFTPQ